MSFILNSNGLQVTNSNNKTLFDSNRATPHITNIVTGTLTLGLQTGYVGTINYYTLNGVAYPTEQYCELVNSTYNTFTGSVFDRNKSFLISYYKVNLPSSNSNYGVSPIGDTGGDWISASGGLLLRSYNARREFTYTGAFQGSQYVHAFIPSNGTLQVEVVTNICGHIANGDALWLNVPVSSGNTTAVIPHTAFTVDYKIFIGTT